MNEGNLKNIWIYVFDVKRKKMFVSKIWFYLLINICLCCILFFYMLIWFLSFYGMLYIRLDCGIGLIVKELKVNYYRSLCVYGYK